MTAPRDPDALARAVAADLARLRAGVPRCPWCGVAATLVHAHFACDNATCPYRGYVVAPCCEGTPRP